MKKLFTIIAILFAIASYAQVANIDAYRVRARNFFIFQNDTIFSPSQINAAQFQIKNLADATDEEDAVNLRTLRQFSPDSTGSFRITDTLYIFNDTIIYITAGDSLVTKEYLDSLVSTLAGGHDAMTLEPSAILSGLTLSGQKLSAQAAGTSANGYLTAGNFNIFNNKLAYVTVDNTLSGLGTIASPIKVDTTKIATKYYVDTSDDWGSQVVQTDNTLIGQGIVGNTLKVDTTKIATRNYSDQTYVAIADSLTKYVTITQLKDSLSLVGGGHNPVTIGTANGLSLSTQELSLAQANAGTTGALHMNDWTKFNSKLDSVIKTSPLTGFGTTINPLGIDTTNYVATKYDLTGIIAGGIVLSGDVTGSGVGTITTSLANGAVTLQTLANPTASSIFLYSNGSALRSARLDSIGKTSGLFSAGYIHGRPISTTTPTTGQVLSYNGTSWVPVSGASNWTVSGSNIWRNSNVAVGSTTYLSSSRFSVDIRFGAAGTTLATFDGDSQTYGVNIINSHSAYGEQFPVLTLSSQDRTGFNFYATGRLRMYQYGGTSMDGTVTKLLGVDSNGYVYSTPVGGGGGGTSGGDVYSRPGTYINNQIPRFSGTTGDTLKTSTYPVIIGDNGNLDVAANRVSDFAGRFYNQSSSGYGMDIIAGSTSSQDILRLRTTALNTRFQFRADGSVLFNTYGGSTHAPSIGETYKFLVVNTSGQIKEVDSPSGGGDMTKAVYDPDDNGIFAPAQGGTGNQFFQVSGPASSTKTFTFPNANATVLTTNAAVTAAQGGTGITSFAAGDILYATGASTLAKLGIGTNGQVLAVSGSAPVWTSSVSAGGWTDNGTTVNLTTATDNVGIGGSANVAYKVYVTAESGQSAMRAETSSTSGYAGYFANSGTSGNSYGIYASSGSGINGYAGYFSGRLFSTHTIGGQSIYLGSGSSWWGIVNSGGGLSIGNTTSFGGTSISRVRVYADSVRIDPQLLVKGAVIGNSTFTGTNFILSSDSRLKTRIKPIRNLSFVDKIYFYNFHFKDDLSQRKRYGVIAQEVEKVAPEFVYENERGIKSVAYTDLLIAKTARQDEQIKQLQKEVEELKKTVEILINKK